MLLGKHQCSSVNGRRPGSGRAAPGLPRDTACAHIHTCTCGLTRAHAHAHRCTCRRVRTYRCTRACTHRHVCARACTHPCLASDSTAPTSAPRLSAGPGADTGRGGAGGGQSSCLAGAGGSGTLGSRAEGALTARPCGLDLRNLHPVIGSGNRAFPRTMGCRVSELGRRLCMRSGAWQPFRGLCQTSSGFAAPRQGWAGGGGCC